MKIPSPRVKVITWSKQMKLKRRFEVRVVDGGDRHNLELGESGDGVPFARFAEKGDAEAYADRLKSFLGAERMRDESGRVVDPAVSQDEGGDTEGEPLSAEEQLPLPLDAPPSWDDEPSELARVDAEENPR